MKPELTLNWYELKNREFLFLEEEVLQNFIHQGIKKAGSLSRLCKELGSTHFYKILREGGGVSVDKLRLLLDYINMEYATVDKKIKEIRKGSLASIKNPRFPIFLSRPQMGSLLGHVVSDGCLYYDSSRKNLIRTKYYSDRNEAIEMFIQDFKEIFGETNFSRENARNCTVIRFGNGIVGEAFKLAGAPVGKKYQLNCGIPKLIRDGGRDMQRFYLSAIFDDEGSVGKKHAPYIILSRNIHIKLTSKEKEIVNTLVVPLMKTNYFPTNHSSQRISVGNLRKVLEKNHRALLNKILKFKPQLLIDESSLLKNEFDITNHLYTISLQITPNKNYSVQSSLVIRRKDSVLKFYKNIGFRLEKKQNRLKEALIYGGWL